MRRLLTREQEQAKRADNAGRLLSWADDYYTKHLDIMRQTLGPFGIAVYGERGKQAVDEWCSQYVSARCNSLLAAAMDAKPYDTAALNGLETLTNELLSRLEHEQKACG